jgi:hypothetical protein
MAQLTEVSFAVAGSMYKLILDFDDAALINDVIAFDVTAERTGGKLGNSSVVVRVEIKPQNDSIAVLIAGQIVFQTDVFDHGPTPIEQFLQMLPSTLFGGDPILGCAVKAGLSAIIGQAIECARSLEQQFGWRVVSNYLRCMSQHFSKISKIAMFRAFRCIVGADGA